MSEERGLDLIGRRISHYEILGVIGEGGMGLVYEARDLELGRRVALKVLPSDVASDRGRLERFRREARALAGLNHPNIVTVHSVEQEGSLRFITMELVDGERLDQLIPAAGMTAAEFFRIAIPLTDGLAAAHERGFTHRDVKPPNVMVSSTGRVKLLDFGLAKLRQLPGAEDTQLTTETETRVGRVMGTLPYMSPEQIQGMPVDHRSDIFSLGVVFYQMLTGRPPFAGTDLATRIPVEQPRSLTEVRPELPPHLWRIVRHCLEKDPDRRCETASQLRKLLEDLRTETQTSVPDPFPARRRRTPRRRWLAWAGVLAALLTFGSFALLRVLELPQEGDSIAQGQVEASIKMLAVLPFDNLGPPGNEYFTAGVAEEITARLSSVDQLGVIARRSVERVRDEKSLRRVGEELGVDYVLDGTVRWDRVPGSSDRVRITPRLVRVADEVQVWSASFDGVLEDIFEVQSQIADETLRQLEVTLFEDERRGAGAGRTRNLEAHGAYLRALEIKALPFSDERMRRAAAELERAVELDPAFAVAHAELSRVHSHLFFNTDPTEERLARSREALERAQGLDPALPEVRLAAAYYYYRGLGDYDRAYREFSAAAERLPSSVDALKGMGYVLRRQGNLREALEELERAYRLDPLSMPLALDVAETYRALREYAEANRYLDVAISLEPDEIHSWDDKAMNALVWKGSTQAARRILRSHPAAEEGIPVLSWVTIEMYERDFTEALDRVAEAGVDCRRPLDGPDGSLRRRFRLCSMAILALERLGRAGEAAELAVAGRTALEGLIEGGARDAEYRARLGWMLAYLGWGEEALEQGRQAVELAASDAYEGPEMRELLAAIHALLGDEESAGTLLASLVSIAYHHSLDRAQLRLDPVWDPIRSSLRFRALSAAQGSVVGSGRDLPVDR